MQEELFLMSMMETGEEQQAMDCQRIKSCYPKPALKYVPRIEQECDKMEYEGSPMYADILDRESIFRIARRMADNEKDVDLLTVLLCQEMYVRRCRKANRCRMFR